MRVEMRSLRFGFALFQFFFDSGAAMAAPIFVGAGFIIPALLAFARHTKVDDLAHDAAARYFLRNESSETTCAPALSGVFSPASSSLEASSIFSTFFAAVFLAGAGTGLRSVTCSAG